MLENASRRQALWSIAGIIMKFIPWNGFAVAGMRSLIAGLTFVMYMLIKRMKFIFTKQTFIAGIFAACVYTCFTCANKLTTAAKRDSAAIHLAGVYRDIHGTYI